LKNLWYQTWRVIFHTLFSAFFDIRVYGRENIPTDGPVLLICNHQSYLDPPLCGMAIKRPCGFMARDGLFKIPIIGPFITSVNSIPIYSDNGGGNLKTFKSLINRLKQNNLVVIYPEGSRCYDGTITKFQNGFELIARKSKATIIPMAIEGAYKALPRGKAYINIGQEIKIAYGHPIPPESIKQMPREDFVTHIETAVKNLHNSLK
jgi:1-acyl-sn-glycerol-3-phosphate acyltransferase